MKQYPRFGRILIGLGGSIILVAAAAHSILAHHVSHQDWEKLAEGGGALLASYILAKKDPTQPPIPNNIAAP